MTMLLAERRNAGGARTRCPTRAAGTRVAGRAACARIRPQPHAGVRARKLRHRARTRPRSRGRSRRRTCARRPRETRARHRPAARVAPETARRRRTPRGRGEGPRVGIVVHRKHLEQTLRDGVRPYREARVFERQQRAYERVDHGLHTSRGRLVHHVGGEPRVGRECAAPALSAAPSATHARRNSRRASSTSGACRCARARGDRGSGFMRASRRSSPRMMRSRPRACPRTPVQSHRRAGNVGGRGRGRLVQCRRAPRRVRPELLALSSCAASGARPPLATSDHARRARPRDATSARAGRRAADSMPIAACWRDPAGLPPERRALFARASQAEPLAWLPELAVSAYASVEHTDREARPHASACSRSVSRSRRRARMARCPRRHRARLERRTRAVHGRRVSGQGALRRPGPAAARARRVSDQPAAGRGNPLPHAVREERAGARGEQRAFGSERRLRAERPAAAHEQRVAALRPRAFTSCTTICCTARSRPRPR